MDSNFLHQRRSIRLKDYDYSSGGDYFVTIVTHHRLPIFGHIQIDEMKLSGVGLIVHDTWINISGHFPNVELGPFVVMPNHIHGIITIIAEGRGTACRAPTDEFGIGERFGKPTIKSIPTIIRSYKSAVTKQVNEKVEQTGFPLWQRNYYEHIITTDKEYERIENYIKNNPANWSMDKETI